LTAVVFIIPHFQANISSAAESIKNVLPVMEVGGEEVKK
jgi:hypothetical protein